MREPYNESSSERSTAEPLAAREVRRYPNRRLYDSRSRSYVAIAQIRSWIEAGEIVRVIDVATNEDVTVSTLTPLLVALIERSLEGPDGRSALNAAIRRGSLEELLLKPPAIPTPVVPSQPRSLEERIEALELRVASLERR
jgi:hypothetical protein